MLNITTFLDANALRLNKDVFYCPERNIKYNSREILGIVSGIGQKLKEKGVKSNDCVLIYLDSSPEYLFSMLAIWRIGAIAVPSNRVYKKTEIEYLINDSMSKIVITDLEGEEFIKQFNINTYIPQDIDSFKDYEILPAEPTEWDTLCQLQYTSGTTGKPKGSMLTHGNWFASIHNESDVLNLKENDVALIIYPMAHVGLSWAISALHVGALYIMMERYNLEDYIKLIEEEKVSVLSGMPPIIHSLTNLESSEISKFDSVREIISGGGPLHKTIWRKFTEMYNIPIINAYGLSETIVIGTGTVIRPEDYATADRFESVGHPVCFSECRIVDSENPNKILSKYEHGEIALRGPAVAKGYWNMPKETKKSFLKEGWFLTGDIGYIDDDNRLFVTDRKKDMIVMSGWKIYPTEVEDILLKYPNVSDIAVFSIPDQHKGELPVAAVIWKNEEDCEGLLEYAHENLAGYKIPRKIYTTDKLPRINNWKLLRKELINIFEPKMVNK